MRNVRDSINHTDKNFHDHVKTGVSGKSESTEDCARDTTVPKVGTVQVQ